MTKQLYTIRIYGTIVYLVYTQAQKAQYVELSPDTRDTRKGILR